MKSDPRPAIFDPTAKQGLTRSAGKESAPGEPGTVTRLPQKATVWPENAIVLDPPRTRGVRLTRLQDVRRNLGWAWNALRDRRIKTSEASAFARLGLALAATIEKVELEEQVAELQARVEELSN